MEAFRALNALNEDVFSLDADGIKGLSDFKNNDDFEDDISIIDPEAETAEDLQDNYIGKVILDCCVCHSKLYKAKEEVTIDENGELANVGEECPYCFTPDGFKVIGEVAAFGGAEEEKEESSEESLEEGLLPSMPKLPGLGEEVEDEEAVEEGLLGDVNVSLDASGQSVGLLGGTGGNVTNEELDEEELEEDTDDDYVYVQGNGYGTYRYREELEEGIFGNSDKYKGKSILVYKGNGKDEPIAYGSDEAGNYNLTYFKQAHAKKNGNNESDYKLASGSLFFKEFKKELKSIPDVSTNLPNWVSQYVKNAKAQRALDFKNAERQKEKEAEARRYDSRYTKKSDDDDGRVYVQGKGTGTYKYREELEEGIFDKFKKKSNSAGNNSSAKSDPRKSSRYVLVDVDSYGSKKLATTSRALKDYSMADFLRRDNQSDMPKGSKQVIMTVAEAEKELHTDLSRLIKESIEDLSMTANDTHVEIGEDESGKVTVTMEPVTADSGEMIAPVSDETEAELLGAEEEAPVEGEEPTEEEVDVEVDEVDEESMDELGESYFKRVYENVNGFKTTAVKQQGNSLIVEGKIKFNSGKVRNTSFMFEALDATKAGKVRFVGDNKNLTEGKKAFMLTGKMKGNKLIAESLNYNYKHKDAEGKVSRVYGTERTSRR